MAFDIAEILNRRSDLSTFVVHLTKDVDYGPSALDNLLSIIQDSKLQPGEPMGWAREQARETDDEELRDHQRVVCFSETPLQHIYALFADIFGRQVNLRPFGVAFTKMVARRKGANPVWYIDETPGRSWELAGALDQLRDRAFSAKYPILEPALKLFPFVEPMGTWPTTGKRQEFWWEREWRKRRGFTFGHAEVALWIAPTEHHETVREALSKHGSERPVIDGSWSLERMIASLVGLGEGDVTPFETR